MVYWREAKSLASIETLIDEYTGKCNPFMTSLDITCSPLSYNDGVLSLFG